MHTEPTHDEEHHVKPKHLAERFEGLVGIIMVAAVVLLAIGLIYGIMVTPDSDPAWMK